MLVVKKIKQNSEEKTISTLAATDAGTVTPPPVAAKPPPTEDSRCDKQLCKTVGSAGCSAATCDGQRPSSPGRREGLQKVATSLSASWWGCARPGKGKKKERDKTIEHSLHSSSLQPPHTPHPSNATSHQPTDSVIKGEFHCPYHVVRSQLERRMEDTLLIQLLLY